MNTKLNAKLNKSISGNQTSRCLQDILNVKIITANNEGAGVISGYNNYLVIHQAIDIRDAQQYYCFSVGYISGNTYHPVTIASKNLWIATNSVGTVSIQGGSAAYVKQAFLLIPQINAAIMS